LLASALVAVVPGTKDRTVVGSGHEARNDKAGHRHARRIDQLGRFDQINFSLERSMTAR
jgi:hypothetical protein